MTLKNILNSEHPRIVRYLKDCGFEYEGFIRNPCTYYGYEKVITIYSVLPSGEECDYDIWIHIDLKRRRLNIQTMLNCNIASHRISEEFFEIPANVIKNDDVDIFIDWLDKICEPYFDDNGGN